VTGGGSLFHPLKAWSARARTAARLGLRVGDELLALGQTLARSPRKPPGQVLSIRFDQRLQLRRVVRLQDSKAEGD